MCCFRLPPLTPLSLLPSPFPFSCQSRAAAAYGGFRRGLGSDGFGDAHAHSLSTPHCRLSMNCCTYNPSRRPSPACRLCVLCAVVGDCRVGSLGVWGLARHCTVLTCRVHPFRRKAWVDDPYPGTEAVLLLIIFILLRLRLRCTFVAASQVITICTNSTSYGIV